MDNKQFPNGLTSYLETYYEIVNGITQEISNNCPKLNDTYESHGSKGIVDLAQDLTLKFEQQYTSTWFEIYDFYETIDKFLEEELYEKS